jgi:periplasmic protein TonB
MPLNVRRFGASCLVFLLLAGAALAQATGASNPEDMKQRLARARAYVAVKSYTVAAFELEKIRKESNDPSVQNIALTLLMNCYLEKGDYQHAQDLLSETFVMLKAAPANSSSSYFTVSGQVLKMAKAQLDRYKQLGLSVSDPGTPQEVTAEIEKMRGTLELVVNQAKELSDSKQRSAEAFGLLEEVTNTRSTMARDAYDATRWKNEVADARERLANSQSQVMNVVDDGAPNTQAVQNNNTLAAIPNTNKPNATLPPIAPSTADLKTQIQSQQSNVAQNIPVKETLPAPDNKTPNIVDVKTDKPSVAENAVLTSAAGASGAVAPDVAANVAKTRARTSGEKPAEAVQAPASPATSAAAPMKSVGSLVDIATKKVPPVYPQMAKTMRVGGVVRIDLVVDEQGSVVSANAVQGPDMLKRAAMDAVKQWKFKPLVVDGQPTKASGFVNFNFSL